MTAEEIFKKWCPEASEGEMTGFGGEFQTLVLGTPRFFEIIQSSIQEGRRQGLQEAKLLALNPYGDEVQVFGPEEPRAVGHKIAGAIQKELEKIK